MINNNKPSYQVELQKNHQRTEKELEELQEKLDEYRDHLYSELKKLNQERAEFDRRDSDLKLRERYFRKQEQRLLVVAIVATLFLAMCFAYLELGTVQFGNLVWLSSAGVLGLFLILNLVLYLLDRFGVKKAVKEAALRTLIHLLKSPFYFLKIIWWLMKAIFTKVLQRRRSRDYQHPTASHEYRSPPSSLLL